jgi:hypothetical protein
MLWFPNPALLIGPLRSVWLNKTTIQFPTPPTASHALLATIANSQTFNSLLTPSIYFWCPQSKSLNFLSYWFPVQKEDNTHSLSTQWPANNYHVYSCFEPI